MHLRYVTHLEGSRNRVGRVPLPGSLPTVLVFSTRPPQPSNPSVHCIHVFCTIKPLASQLLLFRRLCFCFLCCTLSIRIRLLLHLVDSLCLSDRRLLSFCRARGLFVFARCALSPCPGAPSSYLPTLPYEDVRIRIYYRHIASVIVSQMGAITRWKCVELAWAGRA